MERRSAPTLRLTTSLCSHAGRVLAIGLLAQFTGCSSDAPAGTEGAAGTIVSAGAPAAAGGMASVSGAINSGGVPTLMAGAPSVNAAGTAAMAGTSSGGSPMAQGGMPTGGAPSAGSAGMGAGGMASGGGYQGPDKLVCNPGTDGDGMFDKSQMGLESDPPEWDRGPGVPAGTLTDTASYESAVFNQHFPYRIYTSANYVNGEPAVFLLFGDGGTFIGGFHLPEVFDNLTAAGDMPPTVALFIDPPSDGDRVQTYDPPTEKYPQFIVEEIIPDVIEGTYSISQDPAAWGTGGYSASGEADWNVLWKTERFGKFFGANASFGASTTYGIDWPETIAAAEPRDLRVTLTNAPVGQDLVDNRGDWTLINRAVAEALAAKGNATRVVIGPGGHGGPNSQRDFPDALRWGFQGCQFTQ